VTLSRAAAHPRHMWHVEDEDCFIAVGSLRLTLWQILGVCLALAGVRLLLLT
jgi:hypothetical protein